LDKFSVFPTIFFAVFFLFSNSSAQTINDIVVSPSSFDVNLTAGDSLTSSFSIQNNYSEAISFDLNPVFLKNSEQSPYFTENDYFYTFVSEFNINFPERYKTHLIEYSISKEEIIDTLFSENLGSTDRLSKALAYYNDNIYFWTWKARNQIRVLNIDDKTIVNTITLPNEYVIISLSHSGKYIYAMTRGLSVNSEYNLLEIDESEGIVTRIIETGDRLSSLASVAVNKKQGILYKAPGEYPNNTIDKYDLKSGKWNTSFFSGDDILIYHITYIQATNTLLVYGNTGYYKNRSLFIVDASTGELLDEKRIQENIDDEQSFSGLATNEAGWPYFFTWLSESNKTIEPSESFTFGFQISAENLFGGKYLTDIDMYLNDADQQWKVVPVELFVDGNPEIEVNPSTLFFRNIIVNQAEYKKLHIVNNGTSGLLISDIAFSDASFSFKEEPDLPLIVPPGNTHNLVVAFHPSEEGLFEENITFSTNDENDETFIYNVSGISVPPPKLQASPEMYKLQIQSNEEITQSLTINNTGNSTLYYQVTGSGDPARLISSKELSPFYLISTEWIQETGENKTYIYEYSLETNSVLDTLEIPSSPEFGFSSFVYNDGKFYLPEYGKRTIRIFDRDTQKTIREISPDIESRVFVTVESHNGKELLVSQSFYNDRTVLYRVNEETGSVSDSLVIRGLPNGVGYSFTENVSDSVIYTLTGRTIYQIDIREGSDLVPEVVLDLTSEEPDYISYSALDNSIIIYNDKHSSRHNFLVYDLENESLSSPEPMEDIWFDAIATLESDLPAYINFTSAARDSVPPQGAKDFVFNINSENLIGGMYKSELLIQSNDPEQRFKGIPLELEVIGIPEIDTNVDTLQFGGLIVGDKSIKKLTLSNSGTENLEIYSLNISENQFLIQDILAFPIILSPTEHMELFIVYEPSSSGFLSSELLVNSNAFANSSLSIILSGSAITPAQINTSTDSFSFTPDTNEVIPSSFTITNSGEEELNYDIKVRSVTVPDQSILQEQKYYATVILNTDFRNNIYYDVILEYSKNSEFAIDTLFKRPGRGNIGNLTYHDGLIYFVDGTKSNEFQVLDVLTKELLDPIKLEDGFYSGFFSLSHDGVNLIGSFRDINSRNDYIVRIDDENGGIVDTLYSGTGLNRRNNVTVNPKANLLYLGDFDSGKIYSLPLDSLYGEPKQLVDYSGYKAFQEISYLSNSNSILVVGTAENSSSYRLIEFNAVDGSLIQIIENDSDYLRALATDENSGYSLIRVNSVLKETLSIQDSALVNFYIDSKGAIDGDYEFEFIVNSNDRDTPSKIIPAQVSVTGLPRFGVSKSELKFESIFTGDSLLEKIVLSNRGTKDLIISSVSISNPQFHLKDIPSGIFVLEPGERSLVELVFAPFEEGTFNAELIIQSNSSDKSEFYIPVYAEALDPPIISVSPTNYSFSASTGDTLITSLNINNAGGSDLNYQIDIDYSDAILTRKTDFFASVQVRDQETNEYHAQIVSISWETHSIVDTIYTYKGSYPYPDALIIRALSYRDGLLYFQKPVSDNEILVVDIESKEIVQHIKLPFDEDTQIRSFASSREGMLISVYNRKKDQTSIFEISQVNGSMIDTLSSVEGSYIFNTISSDLNTNTIYGNNNGKIMLYSSSTLESKSVIGTPEQYYLLEFGYSPEDKSYTTNGINSETNVRQIYKIDGVTSSITDSIAIYNLLSSVVYSSHIGIATKETSPSHYISFNDNENDNPIILEGADKTLNFSIDLTGINEGTYQAEFVIFSNDPENKIVRIPLEITVSGTPELTMSTDALIFPRTIINTTNQLSLKFSNSGSAKLVIENLSITNSDFYLLEENQGYQIPPQQALYLPIVFAPKDSSGKRTDKLSFVTNSELPSNNEIILEGNSINGPVLSFKTDSLDFELSEGDSVSFELMFSNRGDSTLYLEVFSQNVNASEYLPNGPLQSKKVLIIQDDLAWSSDISGLINSWFSELEISKIQSTDLRNTNFTDYDAVFFIADQNQEYYQRLDSSVAALSNFTRQGGTIFYSSFSSFDISMPGGVEGIYDRSSFNYSDVNKGYFLSETDSTALKRISVLTAYDKVPDHANVLLSSGSGYPIITEYQYGKGQIFAMGLTMEYHLDGFGKSEEITELYKQLVRYVLLLDFSPNWLSFDKTQLVINANTSAVVQAIIETRGLNVEDYSAKIIARTNIPGESSEQFISDLRLSVKMRTNSEFELEIPDNYELYQNYPNPFNPSTTIKYGLPKSGFVEIKVFNILGQQVLNLINSGKQPGRYIEVVNADQLSSGVYFYQLLVDGDMIELKKMMLIK
tara:strand:+ start:7291 stop:14202 length:6912 start_codon:yes stop_codon:yes gene_type:complete